MKILFILWLFCLPASVFAIHVDATDPLRIISSPSVEDTAKIDAYWMLFERYEHTNPLKALKYGDAAIRLATKIEDKERASNSYSRLIGYLGRKLNFAKAFQYGNTGILYFNSSKDNVYKARIYNALSALHFRMHEMDKAMFYAKKCVQLNPQNDEQRCLYLTNLAIGYAKTGAFKKALFHFKEVLASLDEMNLEPDDQTLVKYSNTIAIASAYIELGQLDSANHYLQQAEPILDMDAKWNQLKIYYLTRNANFYASQKNYNREVELRTAALHLSANFPGLVLDILPSLSACMENLGKPAEALRYMKQYTHLSDSISSTEKQALKEIISINYQLEKEEIQSQKKLAQKELRNKTTTYQFNLLLLIAIFVVLCATLFIYVLKLRHKKERIQKEQLALANKNMELELEKINVEMANNLLRLVSLNDFILSIKKELEKNKTLFKKEHMQLINLITRKIKRNSHTNIWNEFEIRFNQVHRKFYANMCEMFPDLTQNERRLLTFLRLNLSTKEISTITGQSVNSIAVARVRLRAKLGIRNSGVSLTEFVFKY